MDPAEIRLIQKVFIKGRGAEVFRKILPPPPTVLEAFEVIQRQLVQ